jgi:Zn-dependent protease
MPTSGIRLFRVFGITVFLHFSWLIFAAYELQWRRGDYSSLGWNIAEYLTLFGIVLLHEFGHALACRSVGGTADRIVLWPLGGIAYVSPPPRPGALLWSIVAGPLVNVLLLPVTWGLLLIPNVSPDVENYLYAVYFINKWLLLFNILPIYPLDGGQILQSLLWFIIGRANSLMVATIIGFIGAAGFGLFALYEKSYWLGIIAVFAAFNCYRGFQMALALHSRDKLWRRPGVACPACGVSPPVGQFWGCTTCGTRFDAFENRAGCPGCGKPHYLNTCFDCGRQSPFAAWDVMPPPPPGPLAPLPDPVAAAPKV